MVRIGNANAREEIKTLHLHQYLRGVSLATIASLGFTQSAYSAAAIDRLDRKYGGTRRQTATILEKEQVFPLVKRFDADGLRKFAELLDLAIVNFRDGERAYELQDGAFYT